eukprot:scaffold49001_cov19-Tisochrysis_lutea.AAC.5
MEEPGQGVPSILLCAWVSYVAWRRSCAGSSLCLMPKAVQSSRSRRPWIKSKEGKKQRGRVLPAKDFWYPVLGHNWCPCAVPQPLGWLCSPTALLIWYNHVCRGCGSWTTACS